MGKTRKRRGAALLTGLALATALGLAIWVAWSAQDRLVAGYAAVKPGLGPAGVVALLGEPDETDTIDPERGERQWSWINRDGSRLTVWWGANGAVSAKLYAYPDGAVFRAGPPPTWWRRLRTRLGI